MIEQYVDREELLRLLRSLVVILVGLLIFAVFFVTVIPGLRNANRPAAPAPVSPAAGEMGWLDPTEIPKKASYVIPPVDPKTLIAPSPALLEKGKALFLRNCAQCHGEDGRGSGPAATSINPPPRNFTSSEGWKNGRGLPAIWKTLAEGIRGSSMASFSYLGAADRMALAHEVQALGAIPAKDEDPKALEELEKSLARGEERVPNRIPVSLAMAKLGEEFQRAAALRAQEPGEDSPGAALFRRIVADPARASQTLAGAPSWRNSPADLARAIVPGAPGNGFSPSAATLNPRDWQFLLVDLIKRAGW